MNLGFLTYLWIFGLVPAAITQPSDMRVVAARKGSFPPCNVPPGQTYCESVTNYPYEMVLNALINSNHDIRHLLVSESMDNRPNIINAHTAPQTTERRGPNNPLSTFYDWLETTELDFLGDEGFSDYSLDDEENQNLTVSRPDVSHDVINKRLNRISRKATSNNSHRPTLIPWHGRREKRQDLDDLDLGPPLCRSTSKYLYPQAAMCVTTGEWMFVVNARVIDNRIAQMVKVEVCNTGVEGNSCMGDCNDNSLPLGIVSRCEQHYNQKRLIALSASGSHTILEMFWMPTCCVCRSFRFRP